MSYGFVVDSRNVAVNVENFRGSCRTRSDGQVIVPSDPDSVCPVWFRLCFPLCSSRPDQYHHS